MGLIETAWAQTIANAPTFTQIGGNIVNVMLRFLGFFAIIGLVVTAYLYFTAGGNEEQIRLAKKAFLYSVVGLIVALGISIFVNQIIYFLK